MNISVRKMSYYIESFLKSARTGTVHSVYRKTVNLIANNQLIALQADASPLSPLSLITGLSASEIAKLNATVGEPAIFYENQIDICSASAVQHIFYAEAKRYDLFLSASLNPDTVRELAQNIKAALSQTNTGGFDSIFNENPDEILSPILLAAKKHIKNSFHFYQNKNSKASAACLSQVLGLGGGLTPSGDDFLCGVLAGLKLSGTADDTFSQLLRTEISRRLNDTTDISAAFLSCALNGQYSLAVNNLSSVPKPGQIAATFSEIGHSSGIDTLCGILYAFSLKNICS